MMRAVSVALVTLGLIASSAHATKPPPEPECFLPKGFDFTTATAVVYEGLPHPDAEAPLFAKELESKPVDWRHAHWFYANARNVDATQLAALRKIVKLYSGGLMEFMAPACKRAYHPDYTMVWTSTKSAFTVEIELCFGCGEARVYRSDAPDFMKRCTIGTGVEETFARFRAKRPPLQDVDARP